VAEAANKGSIRQLDQKQNIVLFVDVLVEVALVVIVQLEDQFGFEQFSPNALPYLLQKPLLLL
jgi:hypothetical protein